MNAGLRDLLSWGRWLEHGTANDERVIRGFTNQLLR